MILEKFITGPLQNNTILIGSDKKVVIVDPSFGSFQLVSDFIEKKHLVLEKILITHSHYDHIAEVKLFKNKFLAKVFIHKLDLKNLENPGSDGILGIGKIEGIKPDGFLEDGDKIKIGDIEIEVIHTPGHTLGSICFYIKKEKILISGDTLFKGAFGRLDLPTSDRSKMLNSLKKLSKLPQDTRVIAGHGQDTTIGKEKWLQNPEKFFAI
jgi:hydroxyacylglutathione hydrolase